MPLERGDRLGPYEVQSLLGAGGMGEVYRARDTRLARDVALKVISARHPPPIHSWRNAIAGSVRAMRRAGA